MERCCWVGRALSSIFSWKSSYCGIALDNTFRVATEKCHWTENVNIYPATKEQRDALMKAMADAGYTFDFEKKELKKIEKKSDWSEHDEYTLKGIVDEILANKHDAQECEWITYDRFLNWLKSIKDRVQPQPKQEWSVADESHCQMLQKIICNSSASAPLANKLSDWLTSLKERITNN